MLSNTHRITLVSFLCYFVLSSMLAPIGIITGPMAERFGVPVTDITQQFSWLTGGTFIGAVLALFIFDHIPLRPLLLSIYGLIALGLLSLGLLDSLAYAGWVLGFVGVGSGIGLAAAAFIISRSYEGERRASLLVITDGCFSMAGFVVSWLAGYFIAHAFGWSASYQAVGIAAALIFVLTLVSTFPATQRTITEKVAGVAWPVPVWVCVAGLFLYTLGQSSMLFWLPNFATTHLHAEPQAAGALVGQFWLGMFLGQIFVSWWVYQIGLRRLALLAAATTLIGSVPLWTLPQLTALHWLALLWGLANLSMLKVLLSLATTFVPVPGPKLVSGLLLGATLGTAVSPSVSSLIVKAASNQSALMFSSGCYVLLLILILWALTHTRTPAAPRDA